MSAFGRAFDFTLAREGGYVNHSDHIEHLLRAALFAESNKYVAPYIPTNIRAFQCAQPGCCNPAYARGLCNAHYLRQRRGADMALPLRNVKNGVPCIDCGAAPNAKGGWMRCAKHFKSRRGFVMKRALVAALGGRCHRCHGYYPVSVYDFHHTGFKTDQVSHLIQNASIAKLAQEASACTLLCANCHRIEHHVI